MSCLILRKTIAVYILIIISEISLPARPGWQRNDNRPLAVILDSLDATPDSLYLLIDKSDYKLYVQKGTCIIKEYPVVFGGNPKDDKLMQGDQCTPEGTFYMKSKYPHNRWSKFIWINYPNQDSWVKHAAAKNRGVIPQGASIGGQIGIHGVPQGYDSLINQKKNWTLGCISMRNRDVEEIYSFINEQTCIIIRK